MFHYFYIATCGLRALRRELSFPEALCAGSGSKIPVTARPLDAWAIPSNPPLGEPVARGLGGYREDSDPRTNPAPSWDGHPGVNYPDLSTIR